MDNSTRFAPPSWISGDTKDAAKAAPFLERRFELAAKPKEAFFEVAVAGWHEVYVNGERIGDAVLSPTFSQPDMRVHSIRHDISAALREGANEIAVLLGNGVFNNATDDIWGFGKAIWNAAPMIRGSLVADGRTVLVTDGSWTAYDSPIVFNAFRLGETYDARIEGTRPNERPANVEKYSPQGVVSPDMAVPCRPAEAFEPVSANTMADGSTVYDFGANIAGWCEFEVEGEAGARITAEYDEKLNEDGTLKRSVGALIKPHPLHAFQSDVYILAGREGGEKWHARFAYYGFRYAQVWTEGKVRIRAIRSRFVHSDFVRAGTLETSDPDFSRLQNATMRSYLSNFVGIPTDCPHREKNGWTGDAQLAMETGLWNFDARRSYENFLEILLDAQAPNGAVPCIAPRSSIAGFGWGSGPAWDAILFEIPWQLLRFYGDDAPARRAWPAMKRYLEFIGTKEDADGLVDYGLGDWCAPKRAPVASTRLTDSAYCYCFNRRAAFWARRFGEEPEAVRFEAKAEAIKAAFNKAFYKGDGIYADGGPTVLAAPLYFKGLCADGEEKAVAEALVRRVRADGHTCQFGIFGSKWVARALADHGYADDAWLLFTQKGQPGFIWPLDHGAESLWEDFFGDNSRNHIMFGDLSAWAYEYAAGIVAPTVENPGFRRIILRPHYLKGVASFAARHTTPFGDVSVSWRREGDGVKFEYSVPEGVEVEVCAG